MCALGLGQKDEGLPVSFPFQLSVATSNSAMSQQISSTAMFTTLSGSFDHPKQEFTVGVQLQFQG